MDQFVTRFLLRETVSQLQALQSSLEGASDTLEAQARVSRYVRSQDNLQVQFMNDHISTFQVPQLLSHSVVFVFWGPNSYSGAGSPRKEKRVAGLGLGPQSPGKTVLSHPGPTLFEGPSPWPCGFAGSGQTLHCP